MKAVILGLLCYLFAFSVNAKEFVIGVSYWSATIEGQVAMSKGLEEQAVKINKTSNDRIKLITKTAGDGSNGVRNQIKQMNELIKLNPDLIIIQPTDTAALGPSLLKANAKKIPVITYDQFIVQGQTVSYITSNNYQAGHLGGEYIAGKFDNKFVLKIILVEFPSISSTNERVHGFIDALKESGQAYKVIETFNAVEPIAGAKAGKKVLKHYPAKGSVDVVFTVNDGGGLAVVDVLSKAGRNEILVATVDGDPSSVKNIKDGNLTVIDSAQFCAEIGRESLNTAYSFLKGNKVAKKILIPTFPITKETIKKYPGWMGKVPGTFLKPWIKNRKSFWNNKYKRIND
ncbi:MAG: ribose transport system substrate-binding protein [Bacteriovoracaceae bacterium]|jgi:ribose transport system substrate-binding protein